MSRILLMKVQGRSIGVTQINDADFICLTDIVKGEEGTDHIRNWMRNRNTVEFLGLWETLNNPHFKGVEFDTLRKQAGLNSFNLTPRKWIDSTDAIGIVSVSGKNGGTYAHVDIALEFCSWFSPQFKLYLITEFKRLKEVEGNQYNIEWNVKRVLSKANYRLHTDTVKQYIIPVSNIAKDREGIIYATEADILNIAVFGFTSKEWKEANPTLALKGLNIRDIASINELNVLSNLEYLNSLLIKQAVTKEDRLRFLKKAAQDQLTSLNKIDFVKSIKKLTETTYTELQKKIG